MHKHYKTNVCYDCQYSLRSERYEIPRISCDKPTSKNKVHLITSAIMNTCFSWNR